jgi:hypothetical protein
VFSERIQRCRILYGDLCSPTPFVRGSRSYQSATGTHRGLIFTPSCKLFIPLEFISYPNELFLYLVQDFHTYLV